MSLILLWYPPKEIIRQTFTVILSRSECECSCSPSQIYTLILFPPSLLYPELPTYKKAQEVDLICEQRRHSPKRAARLFAYYTKLTLCSSKITAQKKFSSGPRPTWYHLSWHLNYKYSDINCKRFGNFIFYILLQKNMFDFSE